MNGQPGRVASAPGAPALRWIFPATSAAPASASVAREFLAQCEATDRQLLALVYGYALDLGQAAWVLDHDPALAHWRLRAALSGESLERGVAALLAGADGPTAEALRLAAELPAEAAARMRSALDGTRVAASARDSARPGLGVGSLVIVVLAIAAFLLYGVIRDTNPLWHGKDLLRRGDFATARRVFEELGNLPEARGLTAIAWLAEGDYAHALEALATPGASSYLAVFRPMDEPLEAVEADPASLTLLPRGLIATTNPTLVYQAGPGGELVLLGRPFGGAPDALRPLRIRVPDTRGGPPIVALNWPAELGPLTPGDYTWTVPGSELHPGSFTLLPDEQRLELESHARERLSNELPYPAIAFLRGHYSLRNRLYVQAGQSFAVLARRFPEQPYPREMVHQIAAALGVDPLAFLR